jgi:hypothetical protein
MSSWILANADALPGVGTELVAAQRQLLLEERGDENQAFPIGGAISGTYSADPDNPTGRTDIIRDGMPMGRITATNKWAPSIIGQLGAALSASATNLVTLSAAQAAEITRRIGATGTFKLTGPSSAAGTVRTLTVTFSSVGAGSGQNAVNKLAWTSQPSAGTFTLTFLKSDGTYVTTAAIAYDATVSTTVANAIIAVLGTAAVSAAATASTEAFNGFSVTYSGTGYTLLAQPAFAADISSLTQATAGYTVTQTTIGVPVAGTVTITSPSVNAVQRVDMNIASTGGNVVIELTNAAGARIRTTPAAWNATDATYLAAIQTVLDVAAGVANGIVVTAIPATDTDLGFILTFSGTGYAALAQPLVTITTLPTSTTATTVSTTTAGVPGGFVAGSLIQPTDGSENIRSLLVTGQKTGVSVLNALLQRIDVHYPVILHSAIVRTAYILGYPGNDASTKAWIKAQLRTYGGKWLFDDDFLGISV